MSYHLHSNIRICVTSESRPKISRMSRRYSKDSPSVSHHLTQHSTTYDTAFSPVHTLPTHMADGRFASSSSHPPDTGAFSYAYGDRHPETSPTHESPPKPWTNQRTSQDSPISIRHLVSTPGSHFSYVLPSDYGSPAQRTVRNVTPPLGEYSPAPGVMRSSSRPPVSGQRSRSKLRSSSVAGSQSSASSTSPPVISMPAPLRRTTSQRRISDPQSLSRGPPPPHQPRSTPASLQRTTSQRRISDPQSLSGETHPPRQPRSTPPPHAQVGNGGLAEMRSIGSLSRTTRKPPPKVEVTPPLGSSHLHLHSGVTPSSAAPIANPFDAANFERDRPRRHSNSTASTPRAARAPASNGHRRSQSTGTTRPAPPDRAPQSTSTIPRFSKPHFPNLPSLPKVPNLSQIRNPLAIPSDSSEDNFLAGSDAGESVFTASVSGYPGRARNPASSRVPVPMAVGEQVVRDGAFIDDTPYIAHPNPIPLEESGPSAMELIDRENEREARVRAMVEASHRAADEEEAERASAYLRPYEPQTLHATGQPAMSPIGEVLEPDDSGYSRRHSEQSQSPRDHHHYTPPPPEPMPNLPDGLDDVPPEAAPVQEATTDPKKRSVRFRLAGMVVLAAQRTANLARRASYGSGGTASRRQSTTEGTGVVTPPVERRDTPPITSGTDSPSRFRFASGLQWGGGTPATEPEEPIYTRLHAGPGGLFEPDHQVTERTHPAVRQLLERAASNRRPNPRANDEPPAPPEIVSTPPTPPPAPSVPPVPPALPVEPQPAPSHVESAPPQSPIQQPPTIESVSRSSTQRSRRVPVPYHDIELDDTQPESPRSERRHGGDNEPGSPGSLGSLGSLGSPRSPRWRSPPYRNASFRAPGSRLRDPRDGPSSLGHEGPEAGTDDGTHEQTHESSRPLLVDGLDTQYAAHDAVAYPHAQSPPASLKAMPAPAPASISVPALFPPPSRPSRLLKRRWRGKQKAKEEMETEMETEKLEEKVEEVPKVKKPRKSRAPQIRRPGRFQRQAVGMDIFAEPVIEPDDEDVERMECGSAYSKANDDWPAITSLRRVLRHFLYLPLRSRSHVTVQYIPPRTKSGRRKDPDPWYVPRPPKKGNKIQKRKRKKRKTVILDIHGKPLPDGVILPTIVTGRSMRRRSTLVVGGGGGSMNRNSRRRSVASGTSSRMAARRRRSAVLSRISQPLYEHDGEAVMAESLSNSHYPQSHHSQSNSNSHSHSHSHSLSHSQSHQSHSYHTASSPMSQYHDVANGLGGGEANLHVVEVDPNHPMGTRYVAGESLIAGQPIQILSEHGPEMVHPSHVTNHDVLTIIPPMA
ncbi:hypothetical protein DL93DRAFT_2226713 [Clavulina sp. PMI_390]|nr:hypothetical protein DL93DRAFT_2226713 [Clavulina sp. PMI_390]